MCGFCGFTGSIQDRENIIKKMMSKIIHRGPDSEGVHTDEKITMGFRRLSIIGLSDGSQPMYNEDGSLVLVFNGEIYNYKDLREELIKKGHIFKTHADTEVLVHLYEEKGRDMLEDIRGMFAFAIYDKKDDSLFAARDFFGIKPFYYANIDGNMLFGSEIKSFLEYTEFKKEVNPIALENYLTFQYSVLEETFFKGVYKLMPGHFLTFKKGEIKTERYFNPMFLDGDYDKSLHNVVTEVDDVLQDSVLAHKVSDVEVGSFLSSGVDSSYVAASFKGDKTFTVGFDYDKYNEIGYAEKLSKEIGVDNRNKTITTEEYWNALSKVQYHMDEPLADPSAVALYFVSSLASKYVKVALSGEGADEFFGGYNIYREPMDLSLIMCLPKFIRKFFAACVKLIPFSFKGKNFFIRASKDVEERFIGNAYMFTKEEREEILKSPSGKYDPRELTKPFYESVKDKDDITKMQFIDMNFWLVGDILLKADKMSMANSLEVRVPFLDKEVFKVASNIRSDFRVNRVSTKYAFRLAAKDRLPEMVANKKKLGFPVPIRIWLKEDKYYNIVKKAFTSKTAEKYFNIDKIVGFLDRHKNGKGDFSRKIWTIYMFLVWHKEYFE
ncbi:MAG: asparagine synthase (glutamine-hydrolyzing) [Clostridiales bacterium]|nr:asparagine synthase (glutamine-hydrolyzing) [Clostridiales bacterium]